jgi:hypothetical protein
VKMRFFQSQCVTFTAASRPTAFIASCFNKCTVQLLLLLLLQQTNTQLYRVSHSLPNPAFL